MMGKKEARPTSAIRFMVVVVLMAGVLAYGILLRIGRLAIISSTLASTGRPHTEENETANIPDIPEVAWLMTFPNSGTTYTLKLIQQYTNTTTATNYGNEQNLHEKSIPVHAWMRNGPFLRYTDWNLPPRYILTKTHCGGTTLSSDPLDYVETARSFEIACRSGNQIADENEVEATYSMEIPKRFVHLIRNPFDNIVARLHLEERRWSRKENRAKKLQVFNATRNGFRAWCVDQDRRAFKLKDKSRYMDDELWNIAKHVPCHGELIRYTWWHNHAIELTRRKNLPVHSFFYEDYENSWDRTVDELFQFLVLSPARGAQPPPFVAGKHYMNYYGRSDAAMAKALVNTLASPETWNLIRHYFPE